MRRRNQGPGPGAGAQTFPIRHQDQRHRGTAAFHSSRRSSGGPLRSVFTSTLFSVEVSTFPKVPGNNGGAGGLVSAGADSWRRSNWTSCRDLSLNPSSSFPHTLRIPPASSSTGASSAQVTPKPRFAPDNLSSSWTLGSPDVARTRFWHP